MASAARIVGALALLGIAGCASQRIVDHSFSFNALQDSPDVVIMDYRYGASRQPTARNDHLQRDQGISAQSTTISGPMELGEDLYVKWRVKSTGAIYEDTVDLRRRLPRDITGQRLYFIAQGAQLHVYLISMNERRPPDMPAVGPKMYSHMKVVEIYPEPVRR